MDAGDVGNPFGLRLQRHEVSLKVIPHTVGPDARSLPSERAALRHSKQPFAGHQSRHPVRTVCFALLAQFFMHTRYANDAATCLVPLANPYQQALIVGFSCTRGPLVPGMKAAGRHRQASTHQLDRIENATALNRPILQLDSLAKNAAASCKKSLLLHASQLSFKRGHHLIPGDARSSKSLCFIGLQFSSPATQKPRTYANFAGHLTELHSRLAGQANGLTLELVAEFSSLGHDTLFCHHRTSLHQYH